MKIWGALRGAVAFAAFCLTSVGMNRNAHAGVVYIADQLEADPTDWSLYFTVSSSLAFHYTNNAALARSGKGVTLLAGYIPGYSPSTWKGFQTSTPYSITACGFSVYLKKYYSQTQQVRLTLVNTISNTYVAQTTVNVTSSSYTKFSLPNTYSCEPWLAVGIELISTGPTAGVLVDDVTVQWSY